MSKNVNMQNPKKKKVIVIGAGFSGLSSACYLAKSGFEVLVIEKNKELGGRARTWQKETELGQFTFDMGPSWYWMPRVFEDFFKDFEKTVADFYDLRKLPIQYRMFLKEDLLKNINSKEIIEENSLAKNNSQIQEIIKTENQESDQNNSQNLENSNNSTIKENIKINSLEKGLDQNFQLKTELTNDFEQKLTQNYQDLKQLFGQNWVDLPDSYHKIKEMFELIETGSGAKLDEFVNHGEFTYDKGVREYMQKPSLSVLEFANFDFLTGLVKAGILQSFGKFVRKNFKSPIIRQMLEFPVLFLGATPQNTPKIYTLMAYTCLKEGTFYPDGGLGKVSEALVKLAQNLGVKFQTSTIATKISDQNGKVSGIWVRKN